MLRQPQGFGLHATYSFDIGSEVERRTSSCTAAEQAFLAKAGMR